MNPAPERALTPPADTDPEHLVDVDRLVGALRGRVADLRARGAYGGDVGGGPLPLPEAGDGPPHVVFRPELAYSSKRVVGPGITAAKQVTLRALVHVFQDLARQTDVAVARTWGRVDDLERRYSAALGADPADDLGVRLRHAEEHLASETAAREAVQRDIAALSQRLDAFERRVEDMRAPSRLARLERERRAAPPVAPVSAPGPVGEGPAATPAAGPAPMVAGFDYESFEGRFRPEERVRVHQRGYLDVLGDRTRVVDIGCGRGELVEILGERGVDAYGLELDADFVALAAERGVDVRHGDGIAHLEGLTPGEVDAVVASHVVEHLEPRDVLRLVDAAAAVLPEGGVLVLETPNAESLVAGSVNFHRDLSHRRPIHPDTLAFVCESAGFGEVEVRRLSPVPDAELLPMPPEGAPGAEALSPVVERLNALIYGFQDYAVVARR